LTRLRELVKLDQSIYKERVMLRILPLILTLSLMMVACKTKTVAPGELNLNSEKKKLSYVIGQQMGQSLKVQGIEIDSTILAASVQHVLDGKESQIKPEEMRKVMMEMQKAMVAKREGESEVNKDRGSKFLKANKKKTGVKVTKSGLQYKVLKAGKGKSPTKKDKVKVHYRGTLIDGSEFDSSYKRKEPAEFPVTGVIKGWTEALQMMKVGGKWELYIPSDLAYGGRSRPSIPAHSVLIFQVELLEVKS